VKLTTHLHLVPRSKNEWSYTSIPPVHLHNVVLGLKKNRDNFTFSVNKFRRFCKTRTGDRPCQKALPTQDNATQHRETHTFICASNGIRTDDPSVRAIHNIRDLNCATVKKSQIREPFAKFVDSPYYSESELCGGAMTVSFSRYLPWQAMHFLERSTHFSETELRSF
jgi:hypothetical protein